MLVANQVVLNVGTPCIMSVKKSRNMEDARVKVELFLSHMQPTPYVLLRSRSQHIDYFRKRFPLSLGLVQK